MSESVSLNPAQQRAVTHVDGPLLILAGPGSGKTRVVTHRIAHLVQQGIDPRCILALTFTNKAAGEMQSRVQRLVPGVAVWVSTFHRFCSQLLRRNASLVGLDSNFTIYDASDSRRALGRAMESLSTPIPSMSSTDTIARRISWLKNQMVAADDYQPGNDPLSSILVDVYPAYQRELQISNAVDFDDLLLHVVRLLRDSDELRAAMDDRYRYVMVDEYQDTNLAQYAIVRAISNQYPNLAVTGDPDQSIYGWRGANLRNILDFELDFPDVTVVRLEENYRNTPNILQIAQSLIANNVYRKPKQLFTHNAEGNAARLAYYESSIEEADQIVDEIADLIRRGVYQASDIAIFYRNNSLSRSFEHAFRAQSIPFQIVNGVEFYQRREVKDLLAYLQLINNPQDNIALARIINVPSRRIGKTTLNRLSEYAQQHGLSLFAAARDCDQIASISKAIRSRVKTFVQTMDEISQAAGPSLEEMLGLILTTTAYREYLAEVAQREDQDRVANVDELLQAARGFDQENNDPDAVGAFLEQAALVNDTDNLNGAQGGVTLMTLHSAKGLEFPAVYIVGLEQGLLPHQRSLDEPAQLEEERRLLFVGITRAQQRLQLSMARSRPRSGSWKKTIQSQFLVELPRADMQQIGDARASSAYSQWSDDDRQYSQASGHDDSVPSYQINQDDGVTTGDSGRSPRRQTPRSPKVVAESPTANGPGEAWSGERKRAKADRTNLQTAAQWMTSDDKSTSEVSATSSPAPRVDPEQFELGMIVIHPEYGPGKIEALSGAGRKRQAIVNFATVGRRTIILVHSQLRLT